MPTQNDIKRKISPHRDPGTGKMVPGIPAPNVAVNYMKMLSDYTGRNVIAYYSSYPGKDYGYSSMVNEWDISGFMKVMNGLDTSKGLDLILQTPGGVPTAAEGIVEYLQAEFQGDIRVIVPYCAFSAGTLISCAAKSIVLGRHSFLGPVDPQLGANACLNIIREYDEARQDITENPNSMGYWNIRLADYDSGIYMICKDAVALGDELLNKWLKRYMFAGETGKDLENKVRRIYRKLNSNNNSHGRHFGYEFCKNLGLKVEQLEADPDLQDLVLGIHHAMELAVSDNDLAKFIISQKGEHYALLGSCRAEE
jgi:hypothetical protein